MFCGKCGAEILNGNTHCVRCGNPVEQAGSQPQLRSQPQTQAAPPLMRPGFSTLGQTMPQQYGSAPEPQPTSPTGFKPLNTAAPTSPGFTPLNTAAPASPLSQEQSGFSFQQQGYQQPVQNTGFADSAYRGGISGEQGAVPDNLPEYRSRWSCWLRCWIGGNFGWHLHWLGFHEEAEQVKAQYGIGAMIRSIFNPMEILRMMIWVVAEYSGVLFGTRYKTDANGVPVTYFKPKKKDPQ